MRDDVLMDMIYSEHPTALTMRMNESLKESIVFGRKKPKIYFQIITGVADPVKQGVHETKYLSQIKEASKEEQKKILLHPLVQIFLERKRMQQLTWIHIFIQLAWILSYTLMVYEMYATTNCSNNMEARVNQTEREGEEGNKGQGHMRILTSLGFIQSEENCRFNQTAVQVTALILYILSALVLLKEGIQMIMKSWGYFKDFMNWIQLGILVVALINSFPAWQLSSASDVALWEANLAAIGIFVAWVMLLSELDNFPKCALYSAILKKVLWNCSKTMLFYLPLLIGFAMCLRILTPGKGQHKYLLFSLVKVVAMMTGELEFEDAFYGDESTSGPSLAYNDILGQIMFLLLVFVTSIVLLNLLTGLAVKDVGQLVKEADVQRLFMQLDRMHMLEGLILFAREKLVWVDTWKNLLYRFSVTGVRGPNQKYAHSAYIKVVIKDYPEELQAKLRNVIDGVAEEE